MNFKQFSFEMLNFGVDLENHEVVSTHFLTIQIILFGFAIALKLLQVN